MEKWNNNRVPFTVLAVYTVTLSYDHLKMKSASAYKNLNFPISTKLLLPKCPNFP